MFAGAAREAVFSSPEVIRRVNAEFVPVSVSAARMHQSPRDAEGKLLWSAGRIAPAPQGIAVLNGDGQVLDWVLMFDSDRAVLDFLDHVKARFQAHPGRSHSLLSERFMRYPSARLPDAPEELPDGAPRRHPEGESCPGRPIPPSGSLVVQVVGRALDEQGRPGADTVHQSQYAQDGFVIPPPVQEQVAAALAGVGESRVRLPDPFAALLVSSAFLGQIDVKPIDNPLGAPSKVRQYELWARRVGGSEESPLLRIEGASHLETESSGRPGAPPFEHAVRLTWQGFLELGDRRITRLVLSAEGTERLRWSGPPASGADQPEVAFLPAGRSIQFDGKVRYGVLGHPVPAAPRR